MGYTNFPNGVTSFGVPLIPDGFTGKHFWVKPYSGSDANSGLSPQNALKTLARALALATANKNDVVHLVAESNTAANTTDYQETALDWNKDAVHLIGENCGAMIGQRSRIAQLSTVKTIEDLVTISADNCLIANIEIFQGVTSSTATSPRALVVSGQRNRIVNCQISGNGDTGGSTDTAGARSLHVSGSENIFQHCYIGLNTVIRATQTAEVGIADSVARTIFEDCHIDSYTSLSSFLAMTYSAPDRFILLKDCILSAITNITSAVAPTACLPAGGSVNGYIMLKHSSVFGYANVTAADSARTLVSAQAGGLVDMGLATGTDIA